MMGITTVLLSVLVRAEGRGTCDCTCGNVGYGNFECNTQTGRQSTAGPCHAGWEGDCDRHDDNRTACEAQLNVYSQQACTYTVLPAGCNMNASRWVVDRGVAFSPDGIDPVVITGGLGGDSGDATLAIDGNAST